VNDTLQMMKALSEADGVVGYEHEVRAKMTEYLGPLSDELMRDRLGSIVGKKVGDANGPKVLIVGHMDEVGWMVTSISDKGFLWMHPLGGWWPHVMLAQRVKIKGTRGDHIGIIGSKAPHALTAEERGKVLQIKDMFIDVGARSREEVEEMGISPGDAVIPLSEFTTLGNGELMVGKALDNRAGCGVAVEVLQRLQGKSHPNVVYSGATVQEEVGCRGAQTLAHLVQPDVAIAVDTGLAYDTPGYENSHTTCNVGDGPLMLLADSTMIPHPRLRKLVMDTAKELGINIQVDALSGGGTDGANIHRAGIGCPTIALGFATRYIHSHSAVLSKRDFDGLVTLISGLVEKLDQGAVEDLLSW
jgi:putative aminopeptidase FrvX